MMATFSDGDNGNSKNDNNSLSRATSPTLTNGPTSSIANGISSTGNGLPSSADLLAHLQTLLDAKKRQLQGAATLGQKVLEQQVELQERVRQLQALNDAVPETADDEKENKEDIGKNKKAEIGKEGKTDEVIGGETRLRYRELIHLVEGWDEDNKKDVVGAFGGITNNGQDPFILSAADQQTFLAQNQNNLDRSQDRAYMSAASSSRRAKNAAHRADDVEFAFEIGTSLLTEVRRLQSLLGERDKAIQDMKEEKDDLEKMLDDLRERARELEGGVDKFKEENWNLEVTLQELRTQLTDSQSSQQKSDSELKRLTRLLSQSRESGDQYKSESERLTNQFEELKARHETDVAQARKVAAGLGREKSDLQQIVEELKKEVARGGKGRRFGSPLTPGGLSPAGNLRTPHEEGDEDDLFLTGGLGASGVTGGGQSINRKRGDGSLFPPDVFASEYQFPDNESPDNSPSRQRVPGGFLAPNHPRNEIEALQQKLAHAQRQLGVLRGVVGREKEGRMKDRKRLIAAGIIDDSFLWENDEEDDEEEIVYEEEEDKTRSGFGGLRGRGRGRGRARGRAIPRVASGTRQGESLANMIITAPDDEEDSSDLAYLKAEDAENEETLEEDDFVNISSPNANKAEDEDAEREEHSVPTSPTLSSRASITADGMDPAFANVLRHSSTSVGSPLRRSIGHATTLKSRQQVGTRRGRGGARGGPSTRPSSLVGEPEALAKELGLGMDSIIETEGVELEPEIETEEFGCQVDLTVIEPVKVEKLIEKIMVEESVQVNPEPIVVVQVERKEMDMQTDPIPEPTLPPAPPPPPVLVDAAVFVDLYPPAEPKPILVDTATWTDVELIDMFTNRRTTLTQEDWVHARNANISARSGDTTIRGPVVLPSSSSLSRPTSFVQRLEEEDEDDRTEMGLENDLDTETDDIETDMEDYQDARSVAPTPTPSESLHRIGGSNVDESDDYHSMSTLTDNDYSGGSSEEDAVSVIRAQRASRVASIRAAGVAVQGPDNTITTTPLNVDEKSYEDQGVETMTIDEVTPKVLEKEKEVVECAIQTDEWLPPAPPPRTSSLLQPAPLVSGLPGFSRVGSGSLHQQFQFIPAPQPATATSSMSVSTGTVTTSQNTSPTTSIIPIPILTPTTNVRDSAMTFGGRQTRLSTASSVGTSRSKDDRRQSIESTLSFNNAAPNTIPFATADATNRPTTPMIGLPIPSSPVDKSKPPTMMLPPPPKMPPPPNAMPPPSFIPEKKKPVTSLNGRDQGDIPPPRPTSPPPPELIQRATTPIFGQGLAVPSGARSIPSIRQHGSSLPPMSLSSAHSLRQPMSTNSFRSATQMSSQLSSASQGTTLMTQLSQGQMSPAERHLRSTTSLLSDGEDMVSRRSSLSSDQYHHPPRGILDPSGRNANVPSTPGRPTTAGGPGTSHLGGSQGAGGSTDPVIIHAITQTMIGEFLYKYTRKAIGKGHGERRHKRFFWVHPYTKTLYWSSADPGSSNVGESSAKSGTPCFACDLMCEVWGKTQLTPVFHDLLSLPQLHSQLCNRIRLVWYKIAYIDSVRSVLDPNPMPPGLYQYSVVISTPQREMKITAPTKERHDIWLNALNYLLSRPSTSAPLISSGATPGEPRTPNQNLASPQSQRGAQNLQTESSWNITPRGRRSQSQLSFRGSVSKRSGTPAAEYLRWTEWDGPVSPGGAAGFEHIPGGHADEDDEELDFEIHDSIIHDDHGGAEGFEGLENVRACCDGKHTVGRHHHHHHHHHPQSQQNQQNLLHQNRNNGSEMLLPEIRPSSPAWSFRSRASSVNSQDGGTGSLFSRFGSRRSARTHQTSHE